MAGFSDSKGDGGGGGGDDDDDEDDNYDNCDCGVNVGGFSGSKGGDEG